MVSNFWLGRNVLVTGASGFIGSHIVELLLMRGANVTATVSPSRSRSSLANLESLQDEITVVEADLTSFDDCLRACRQPDVVINAAHVDGSVAFKQAHPALIFRQNMLITLNMLEAACRSNVERFLVISSTEVYAPETAIPSLEADGFAGLPSRLTDGYAWSKRMSEFAAEVFAREQGLRVAIARPSNVYGPRDHFDSSKGRVIPMFIQKVFQSDEPIVIWGNGEQIRTFLYVGDLVCGLLDLVEKHPACDPVNFSGTEEITIRALADLIVQLSGRSIRIMCDLDRPHGAPNRTPDISKARELLGFTCTTPLRVGLQRTIDLYRERYACKEAPLTAHITPRLNRGQQRASSFGTGSFIYHPMSPEQEA